jgi:hypothetical protein
MDGNRDIMLSEVSQVQKDKGRMFICTNTKMIIVKGEYGQCTLYTSVKIEQ